MKTRLIVLLLTIIVASCGTAKQGCPSASYHGPKYKAPKRSKAPKQYKTSTFNWYN